MNPSSPHSYVGGTAAIVGFAVCQEEFTRAHLRELHEDGLAPRAPLGGQWWAHRGFLEADDGDRTRDPQLGKLMLYQLSYVRDARRIAKSGTIGSTRDGLW